MITQFLLIATVLLGIPLFLIKISQNETIKKYSTITYFVFSILFIIFFAILDTANPCYGYETFYVFNLINFIFTLAYYYPFKITWNKKYFYLYFLFFCYIVSSYFLLGYMLHFGDLYYCFIRNPNNPQPYGFIR